MKIINVIEVINGMISSVESWLIDDILTLSNDNYFTEEEAVIRAETLFLNKAKEEGLDKETNIENWNHKQSDNFPHEYLKDIEICEQSILENGYWDNGNGYEVMIYWSGINVNE
jgi:formate-dependent nitrite reductase cytochrome c552 subunit